MNVLLMHCIKHLERKIKQKERWTGKHKLNREVINQESIWMSYEQWFIGKKIHHSLAAV